MTSRCMRRCVWKGRLWREGDVYEGAETPPSHFQPTPTEGGQPKRGQKGRTMPSAPHPLETMPPEMIVPEVSEDD